MVLASVQPLKAEKVPYYVKHVTNKMNKEFLQVVNRRKKEIYCILRSEYAFYDFDVPAKLILKGRSRWYPITKKQYELDFKLECG